MRDQRGEDRRSLKLTVEIVTRTAGRPRNALPFIIRTSCKFQSSQLKLLIIAIA